MLLLLDESEGGGVVVVPPPDGGGGGSQPPGTGTGGGPVGGGLGTETLIWVEPNGTSTPLVEKNGIIVGRGMLGRLAPKFTVNADKPATQEGAIPRSVTTDPRDVSIPITIVAKDLLELRKREREWAHRLNPRRGLGVLRVVSGDGTARRLVQCAYVGGFEGDETPGTASRFHQRAVLVIRAHRPFAEDDVEVTRVVAGGNQIDFFPLLPFNLSEGAIGAQNQIVNDGDEAAFPIWTVQGPATSITITNETTGLVLDLPSVTLTADQFVVIDTNEGVKTVLQDDGTNLFGALSNEADMWALEPGLNVVTVAVGGSGVTTLASVRYRRRYETL